MRRWLVIAPGVVEAVSAPTRDEARRQAARLGPFRSLYQAARESSRDPRGLVSARLLPADHEALGSCVDIETGEVCETCSDLTRWVDRVMDQVEAT